MNNTLSLAKRAADKAHRVLADYILAKYRNDVRTTVNGYLSGPLDEVRCCHPTAGNRKTFLKHAAAVEALRLNDATLDAYVACLVNAYDVLVNEAALEKRRLELKRAAVKAKADLKKDLNLQEGVSLKGVDVGQYKVILDGLEPVRLHVFASHKSRLHEDLAEYQAKLLAGEELNPHPVRNYGIAMDVYFSKQRRLAFFFNILSQPVNRVTYVLRADVADRIEQSAEQYALAYVQGYAAKLALKVGEAIANDSYFAGFSPVTCIVSSADLWRNSVATIQLAEGSARRRPIKFHTQIILNRSCLGKLFNQYPTRRV